MISLTKTQSASESAADPASNGAGGKPGRPRRALPAGRTSRTALLIVSKYGTLIAMAIMLVIFGLSVPNGAFFTSNNLISIVNQSALTAIIACGLTMVLVVGEFDLSIGYAASLAGVLVTGLIAKQGLPIIVAVLITLLVGGGIGTVNGLLVTKARVKAVVATLGVGTILTGLAFGYTAGVCAAITGILLSLLLGSGTARAADSYLMDSFAAVFLGSATLRDGEFHILGTLIGVLVVNVGFNGLALLGTPTF